MLEWQDLSYKHPRCQLDRAFYDRVRASKPKHKLVEKFVVLPSSGRGFVVKKGQTFRVIEETGPQVGALAFWNSDNTNETFFPAATWSQEGIFVRLYGRMFSGLPFGAPIPPGLPWRRPMITCIEDTVVTNPPGSAYHHHFMGTHCSPELMEMRFGISGKSSCRMNLLRAIEPFGLKEEDLHDNINVFQKAYMDMKFGKIWIVPSDAKAGDYVEFFAELNLLVAISVCPFGDGVGHPLHRDTIVRPLRIEVYETGIKPNEFPKWTDWRPTWRGRWVPPDSPSGMLREQD